MKTLELHRFLEIINRAIAVIRINNLTVELMTFNDLFTCKQLKEFLEHQSYIAYLEHMENSATKNINFSNYLAYLIQLLEEILSAYQTNYGLQNHDTLMIVDIEGNRQELKNLPVTIRGQISDFLIVQKTVLIEFRNKIDQKEKVLTIKPVNECKEPFVETVKVKPEQSSGPSQNIKGEIWIGGVLYYDNEKVCLLLDATKLTMQRYRKLNILSFKKVGNNCFYKASDVQVLFEKGE